MYIFNWQFYLLVFEILFIIIVAVFAAVVVIAVAYYSSCTFVLFCFVYIMRFSMLSVVVVVFGYTIVQIMHLSILQIVQEVSPKNKKKLK